MQKGELPGRPGEPLSPKQTNLLEQGETDRSHSEHVEAFRVPARDEQSAFWDEFIERASLAPSGEDPAFWPIRMLNELNYLIVNKEDIKNRKRHQLVETLTPLKESIGKVTSAYAILAYPHLRHEPFRQEIERQLESAQAIEEKDAIELSGAELEIVRRLCETPRYSLTEGSEMLERKIPFNPQKRIYRYAEVLKTP